MTWRIPARQLSMDDEGIDGDVLKSKLQEFEVDVAETFQKDYKDSRNGTKQQLYGYDMHTYAYLDVRYSNKRLS